MSWPTDPWKRRLLQGIMIGSVCAGAYLGLLYTVQGKLIYMPRSYGGIYRKYYNQEFARTNKKLRSLGRDEIESLDFMVEGQGRATAFYIPPQDQAKKKKSRGKKPPAIWMTFGGNAMLAQDWFSTALAFVEGPGRTRSDGFVFVDYPGYGATEGEPEPATVLRTNLAAVEALQERRSAESFQLRVLAHSLGCAAALQLVEHLHVTKPGPETSRDLGDVDVDRMVLSAPFTSIADMARIVVGPVPMLSLLLKHPWDNKQRIAAVLNDAVARRPKGLRLTIVHGTADEICPVVMGRELFNVGKATIAGDGDEDDGDDEGGNKKKTCAGGPVKLEYAEVTGMDHNSLDARESQLFTAMLGKSIPKRRGVSVQTQESSAAAARM